MSRKVTDFGGILPGLITSVYLIDSVQADRKFLSATRPKGHFEL